MEKLALAQYDAALKSLVDGAQRTDLNSIRGMRFQAGGTYVVPYLTEQFGQVKQTFKLWCDNPRATHNGVIMLRDRSSGARVIIADRRVCFRRLIGCELVCKLIYSCRVQDKSSPLRSEEQQLPVPGSLIDKADVAESCDALCNRKGMTCRTPELVFVNNCEALMAHFPCENGCGHQVGGDIPNYVVNREEPTFQQCLISDGGTDCRSAHHSTQRLCVCSPR